MNYTQSKSPKIGSVSSQAKSFDRDSISLSRDLLKQISNNWKRRAQVKQRKEELNGDLTFNEAKQDFRTNLLPFSKHPAFLEASPEVQSQILSCGWLAYNEKTINIEAKVITPACYHIIYRDIPGMDDDISQQIIGETLVDEAYHIMLVLNACCITRNRRGLKSLKLPDFNLVTNMEQEKANCSETWQKIIVQLVTAIISELFISDYLKLLATDKSIQPFNRLVVDTHRRDEMAHAPIFENLTKCIYAQLNPEQKEFFIEMLPKPVRWFSNMELTVWKAMLEQIGFPKTEQVIADCIATNEINLMRIDYTGVTSLAAELGIFDSQQGIDSFGREGLLN